MRIPTKYVKSGDLGVVTWKTPEPSCSGRLISSKPNIRSGQTFTSGIYKVDYLYRTLNQFDVTCTVRFQVKGKHIPYMFTSSMIKVRFLKW